ncbi:MAG: gliding motility-associated C-terminal domain-containing protein [Bacteroidota bacterium]|nr:gliding motility-associated C-terminal domain-containing protein [Bacteroidota bacterium]
MVAGNKNTDSLFDAFKDAFKDFEADTSFSEMTNNWNAVNSKINIANPIPKKVSLKSITKGISVKSVALVSASAIVITVATLLIVNLLNTNNDKIYEQKNNVDIVGTAQIVKEENKTTKIEDKQVTEKQKVFIKEEKEFKKQIDENKKTFSSNDNLVLTDNLENISKEENSKKNKVIEKEKNDFSLKFIDTAICMNDSIRFFIYSSNNNSNIRYLLRCDGKKYYLNSGYYAIKFDDYGIYNLRFSIVGNENKTQKTQKIIIRKSPISKFKFDASHTPEFSFFNLSKYENKVFWILDDNNKTTVNNPVHEFNDTGIYIVKLIALTYSGCSDTFIQKIDVKKYPKVSMPNSFSPNGDAVNDFYKISIEGEKLFKLTIVNRYKQTVFKSEDKNLSWDGTDINSGKECPEGTYYYFFNYRLQGQQTPVSLHGTIRLFR